MSNFIKVADLSELSETEGLPIKVQNHSIAIFKCSTGEIFAVENSCPHVGAPIHNGTLEGNEVTCLWHSWCFDLSTGESSTCPGVSLKKFPLKVENDEIYISV